LGKKARPKKAQECAEEIESIGFNAQGVAGQNAELTENK
jgi:hypothetical protein